MGTSFKAGLSSLFSTWFKTQSAKILESFFEAADPIQQIFFPFDLIKSYFLLSLLLLLSSDELILKNKRCSSPRHSVFLFHYSRKSSLKSREAQTGHQLQSRSTLYHQVSWTGHTFFLPFFFNETNDKQDQLEMTILIKYKTVYYECLFFFFF